MNHKSFLTGLILLLFSVCNAWAIDERYFVHHVDAAEEKIQSVNLLDAMTNTELGYEPGEGFSPLPVIPIEMQQKKDSIACAMARLDQEGNYADEVPGRIDKLPMGIRKVVGNLDWTLMLTNLTVGADGAMISAYLRLITPQGKTLYLGAEGVKLNSDGGISDMKLVLLGVVDMPMGTYRLVLRGGTLNKTTGMADQTFTYAIIGCQGLKLIRLAGELELSSNMVYPINADTKKADKTQNVKALFTIDLKNWNDLLIQVSLPDFDTVYLGTSKTTDTIDVLANDTYFDLNRFSLDVSGLLKLNADSTVAIRVAGTFYGMQTVTYVVNDKNGPKTGSIIIKRGNAEQIKTVGILNSMKDGSVLPLYAIDQDTNGVYQGGFSNQFIYASTSGLFISFPKLGEEIPAVRVDGYKSILVDGTVYGIDNENSALFFKIQDGFTTQAKTLDGKRVVPVTGYTLTYQGHTLDFIYRVPAK